MAPECFACLIRLLLSTVTSHDPEKMTGLLLVFSSLQAWVRQDLQEKADSLPVKSNIALPEMPST